MAGSHIKVSYAGRYTIDWVPDDSPADHPSPAPRTSPRYIDFISRSLEEVEINKDGLSPATRVDQAMLMRAVLDRAKDPQGRIAGMVSREDDNSILPPQEEDGIDVYYKSVLKGNMSVLKSAIQPWNIGKRAVNDEVGDEKSPRRDAADKKAQRDVPVMYGQKCVLTGTFMPEGAHIVPVRSKSADHKQTWDALCLFWPLCRPADVTVYGQEHRNILPLTHTAHALFDAFYFALRPVAHPQTPSTRIFLQVVYLRDPEGQSITTHWDHRRFGGLYDFRRTPHPKSPAQHQHEPEHVCSVLQHGDVYELVTDDPESYPLPSERLLQVQYGLHQIMSGIRAAGVLREIFRRTPPPGDDGATACPSVPAIWQDLIQEAQDLGILNEDAAARWGRAFAHQAVKDAQDAAEFLHGFFGHDSSSEHGQEDNGNDNDNDQDRHGIGRSVDDQEHDLR